MEILSRLLRGIHRQHQVSYHPKCGRIGLNHLIFADDLMLFVRGDVPFVKAVTTSLDSFPKMYGLSANPDKTNIYMGGIRAGIKQAILSETDEGQKKLIMKSWSSCCTPYQEGGFNIKEILALNKCIICKWIWEIIKQLDGFWVTWNYTYNIKTGNFWIMQKKSNHSECWRSNLQVRDELMEMAGCGDNMQALLGSCVRKGCLKLHLLYEQFRKTCSTISWATIAWNRAILTKHSVFLVMAMQQKLATIDQLNIRGIPIINQCILCKANNETHKHLFFRCSYSGIVWRQLLAWMRIPNRTTKLGKELHCIAGRRVCKHWKAKWYSSCLGAAVYSLWEERNTRIFRGLEHQCDYIVKRVQYFVSVRLLYVTHSSKEEEIIESPNDGC
ncbi:uncharacterized protein LOC141631258 [Silene latifolia]|uniref:uncharacterized protein LOC141631258 n=1 Tax=Silene latifolia TaxID=37657 RepID=UPI003D770FD1